MTRRARVAIAAGLGLALALPRPAAAATIYGAIQEAGKPVADVPIVLMCDGQREAGRTDARGTYRFTIGRTGRCELQVQGDSAPIIVYDDPTRYDFEIRREGGRPRLIRR